MTSIFHTKTHTLSPGACKRSTTDQAGAIGSPFRCRRRRTPSRPATASAWPSRRATGRSSGRPPRRRTLSLYTGTSRLALPVRAPRDDDAELRPFGPAEGAAPPALSQPRPAHHERRLTHDIATGEQVLSDIEEGGVIRLDDSGLEISAYASQTHRIAADDPATASVALVWRAGLRRGDWRTLVETRTEVRASADTLRIDLAFEATEGGRPVRQRRWEHLVPARPDLVPRDPT